MARSNAQPALVPDAVDGASFDPMPPPEGVPAPRRWWGRHLRELRWQAEMARLLVDPVFAGAGVARGHGAPVLTVPGFLAGDYSLSVMHGWLARIGYRPHASGITVNVDCSDRILERLDARLERIHRLSGRRVALIGHSRGGHFIKALASRRPERVSTAISLGAGLDTPFDISLPTKAAVAAVRSVHRRTTDRERQSGCFTDTCSCRFTEDYTAPFPPEVPLTSVYSRADGVVWWEACVVEYAHCVEVPGSHVGLACNRHAYRALAETLAAAAERAA